MSAFYQYPWYELSICTLLTEKVAEKSDYIVIFIVYLKTYLYYFLSLPFPNFVSTYICKFVPLKIVLFVLL